MYNIVSFDFHSPSEHTFDNENYDLELQISFQNLEIDGFAIVSIFFDREAGGEEDNSFLDSLMLQKLTRSTKTLSTIAPEIQLLEFIENVSNEPLYFYEGSLTQPPCSEIVDWIITNNP